MTDTLAALLDAADAVIRHYIGMTPDEPLLSHADIEALDEARERVIHQPAAPTDGLVADALRDLLDFMPELTVGWQLNAAVNRANEALATLQPPAPADLVKCPLCGDPERIEDIVGGVCLSCADGIAFSQNVRRGAVRIPPRIDKPGSMPGGEDATSHEWNCGHPWYGTETECWQCNPAKEVSCCELACYEDPGCACVGCVPVEKPCDCIYPHPKH